MISRQLAMPGAASGASQMRKSSAPPELVVMIRLLAVMLDRVLVARARAAPPGAVRLRAPGIDQVDLGGLVVVRIDGDVRLDCVWPTPT
jgi:hypothetical protein